MVERLAESGDLPRARSDPAASSTLLSVSALISLVLAVATGLVLFFGARLVNTRQLTLGELRSLAALNAALAAADARASSPQARRLGVAAGAERFDLRDDGPAALGCVRAR